MESCALSGAFMAAHNLNVVAHGSMRALHARVVNNDICWKLRSSGADTGAFVKTARLRTASKCVRRLLH